MLTVVIDAMGIGLIIPVMPQLILEVLPLATLGQAAVWGGIMAMLFALMQFLFGPVLGNLSDQYGRKPVFRANLWREIHDTLSPPILAWRLAVRVVCGLSSANMLTCARPICRQKLLGNPKCPRRADNLLLYMSFQTSKNDFAR